MLEALYARGPVCKSKTGLSAQDKQLSTIANNLANASTVGFKRDRAVLKIYSIKFSVSPVRKQPKKLNCPPVLQLGVGARVVGTQNNLQRAVCRLPSSHWMWRWTAALSADSAGGWHYCVHTQWPIAFKPRRPNGYC